MRYGGYVVEASRVVTMTELLNTTMTYNKWRQSGS